MTCISFTIHKFFDMSLFQRINISKKNPFFFKAYFLTKLYACRERPGPHKTRLTGNWNYWDNLKVWSPAMLVRCGAAVTRSLLSQVKAGEKSISRRGLGQLSIPSHLRSTSSSGRHLSTSSALNRKMVSKLSTEERSVQLQPLLAKGQWHDAWENLV